VTRAILNAHVLEEFAAASDALCEAGVTRSAYRELKDLWQPRHPALTRLDLPVLGASELGVAHLIAYDDLL